MGIDLQTNSRSRLIRVFQEAVVDAVKSKRQKVLLVVDEASMMVFPHFLALATLAAPDGKILLAGDHRQLAPITAHDWETEDRPPAR